MRVQRKMVKKESFERGSVDGERKERKKDV